MDEETEIPELPITEEGPTEDIDIEITEDDLGESLADYEQEEADEQPEEEFDLEDLFADEDDEQGEEGEAAVGERVADEGGKRKKNRKKDAKKAVRR